MSTLAWNTPLPATVQDPANTLPQALRQCVETGQRDRQLSMERLADRLGIGHWRLYKWVREATMPVRMVRPFETACGGDQVTRWLASAGDRLLTRIPHGQPMSDETAQTLIERLAEATRELIRFYREGTEPQRAMGLLHAAMEMLAFHRRNVGRFLQPLLPLGEGS